MGRQGKTIDINSDYGICTPCDNQQRSFRNEAARKMFMRLHCKKCKVCDPENKLPEARKKIDLDDKHALASKTNFINQVISNQTNLSIVD